MGHPLLLWPRWLCWARCQWIHLESPPPLWQISRSLWVPEELLETHSMDVLVNVDGVSLVTPSLMAEWPFFLPSFFERAIMLGSSWKDATLTLYPYPKRLQVFLYLFEPDRKWILRIKNKVLKPFLSSCIFFRGKAHILVELQKTEPPYCKWNILFYYVYSHWMCVSGIYRSGAVLDNLAKCGSPCGRRIRLKSLLRSAQYSAEDPPGFIMLSYSLSSLHLSKVKYTSFIWNLERW